MHNKGIRRRKGANGASYHRSAGRNAQAPPPSRKTKRNKTKRHKETRPDTFGSLVPERSGRPPPAKKHTRAKATAPRSPTATNPSARRKRASPPPPPGCFGDGHVWSEVSWLLPLPLSRAPPPPAAVPATLPNTHTHTHTNSKAFSQTTHNTDSQPTMLTSRFESKKKRGSQFQFECPCSLSRSDA